LKIILANNPRTQAIHKTYVQEEKSMKGNNKSIINLEFVEQNDPSVLAATIGHPENLNLVQIVNEEEIIANKPLEKKFKVNNNKIIQKEFPTKKAKSLTGCLRELVDNNAKETQKFQVLCEIRDYLKKIKKHNAKRLKLEQLKVQIKYPDHMFLLSSDSE